MTVSVLLLLFITLPISIISFIFFQKYFILNNYIDNINQRSSHNTVATRSGGIAILFSIFTVSTFFYLTGKEIYNFSILIPLIILALVGLYDDLNKLDFKLKFLFQIVVAKLFIDNGYIIDNLHGLLNFFEINRIIAQLLTIFIVVAIINSINFIDGIDGLAITLVALFIILFEFFSNDTSNLYFFSIIILSSVLPLYYFNFKKSKKIFLGDCGSMFLGGIVSVYVLTILTNSYIIKPQYDLHKIIFVISLLSYPIIDIVRIFFLRILNSKSPFEADKNHIHHRILSRTRDNHFLTSLIILIFSIIVLVILQILF